tara:strand:- start:854 stop:1084 length:231 start_codon:yes stop_codon:yes gene_type:complete
MDSDQTIILITALITIGFVYNYGKAEGRYLGLNERHSSEFKEWELKKLESYKNSRDVWAFACIGLLVFWIFLPRLI